MKDNNQVWQNHFSFDIIWRGMFDMWWHKQVFIFCMVTFTSTWWNNKCYIGSVQRGKERQDDCTSLRKWCKKAWKLLWYMHVFLKLVSAIFIKFLFLHQMIALKKLWKMFFISSKKPFPFWRYYIFFPSFPHFPDSKGQMEVE